MRALIDGSQVLNTISIVIGFSTVTLPKVRWRKKLTCRPAKERPDDVDDNHHLFKYPMTEIPP
jgi:hypothetical protein